MPALPKEMVPGMLATGASARLSDPVTPRFRAGDAVIARNLNPVGHTRLPRYIKGKRGTIRLDHGVFAFPDAAAHGLGHKAQHVYSVRFAAQELWGQTVSPRDSVYIDLFDDYMDPDPAASAAPADAPARSRARSTAASPRRPARPQRASSRKPRKAPRPGVRAEKAAAPTHKKKKAAPAKARKAVAKARTAKPARAGKKKPGAVRR